MSCEGEGESAPRPRPPSPPGITLIDVDTLDAVTRLGTTAAVVYIARERWTQDGDTDPPPAKLADSTGLSVRTVRKALARLKAAGFFGLVVLSEHAAAVALAAHVAHRLGA